MIITLKQLAVFFLVFARISGLFQFAPLFNDRQIISFGKITVIFFTTGIFFFMIPMPMTFPNSPILYLLAIIVEFIIGALIGFTTQILLIGIEMGGSLMDSQAALSAGSQLDPASGRTTTLISKWMRWLAVILFIYINGHHMMLAIVRRSYELIPIATPVRIDLAAKLLATLGIRIFSIALHFALAILLVVFLIDFMFGILSKIAPQVNVFFLGFQVKPTASLLILLLIAPGIVYRITELLKEITEYILRLFLLIQP